MFENYTDLITVAEFMEIFGFATYLPYQKQYHRYVKTLPTTW
jgi:hypothetical protein